MDSSKTNNETRSELSPAPKARASMPKAVQIERLYRMIRSLDQEFEIVLRIGKDAKIKLTDYQGRLVVESNLGQTMDERIVHALKLIYTQVAAKKGVMVEETPIGDIE